MHHKVFLNHDNIIEIEIAGDLQTADVSEICQGIDKLSIYLEDQGKKIRVLVDLSQGGRTEVSAIAMAKVFAKILKFHKLACIQAKNTKILEDIITTAHLEKKTRIFLDHASAKSWILTDKE